MKAPFAVLLALVAATAAPPPCLADTGATADAAAAIGQRLYREGLGHDGRPLLATVQGDVPARANPLACANCHRRSGLGASEGGKRALPVTAAALFGTAPAAAGVTPARAGPWYDERTLRRAVAEGVASDGRPLDPLMPRYRIGPDDAHALYAYLATLGTGEATRGASATELTVATIVADSAPTAEREAVLAVVTRFVELKNRGTRREAERASASRRALYGERHVRGYRRWNLRVWALHGDPQGWPAQLEALYSAEAPFVVLSGAAGDDWPLVHGFCEQHALPCVLPVTELPGEGGWYGVYASEGVATQARVTARAALAGGPGRVLLLAPDNARGRAARAAFVAEWRAGNGANLAIETLDPSGTPDWEALLRRHRPATLVAWAGPPQLAALAAAANRLLDGPRRVYTAEAFSAASDLDLPSPFGERIEHAYPYRLPAPGTAQFPREEAWLRSQGLGGLAQIPAGLALFACHATGEALSGLADNYSRDYLVEALEHMLDGTNMTTLYPLTTLGTGQRILAKGAYLARPGRGRERGLLLDSHWWQL